MILGIWIARIRTRVTASYADFFSFSLPLSANARFAGTHHSLTKPVCRSSGTSIRVQEPRFLMKHQVAICRQASLCHTRVAAYAWHCIDACETVMGSLRAFPCYWRHRWLGWYRRRRVSCAHVPFNGVSSPKKCHNEFLFDLAGNA
jgi:hypothetical protein